MKDNSVPSLFYFTYLKILCDNQYYSNLFMSNQTVKYSKMFNKTDSRKNIYDKNLHNQVCILFEIMGVWGWICRVSREQHTS